MEASTVSPQRITMRLVATLALLLAAATGAAALWESKEQAVQESAKLRPLLDSLMGPTAAQAGPG